MADYKSNFIKNNILTIIWYAFSTLQGLILLPVLVKNYGITIYGGYVLLKTGVEFLCVVSSLGVGFKYKRFVPSTAEPQERNRLFYPQFYFQLFVLMLVFAFLMGLDGSIKKTIYHNEINFSMGLICLVILVKFMSSQIAHFFRFTHRINILIYSAIANSLLLVIFVLIGIFVYNEKTINVVLQAEIYSSLLAYSYVTIKLLREIGFSIPALKVKQIIEDIRLGIPLIFSYILEFIMYSSDRYIIGGLLSANAVGLYSPAHSVGGVIGVVPKALNMSLLPSLAKATDEKKSHEVRNTLHYSIKLFLVIAIPFIAGSLVVGKDVLALFTNWQVAEASFWCVPFIALGILFYGINLILTNLLLIQLRTKMLFYVNMISGTISLTLNLIFISIYKSILVAAITSFISFFISFSIVNITVKRHFVFTYGAKEINKFILSALLMSIVIHFTHLLYHHLLLSVLAGIISYVIFLFTTRSFSPKELHYIRALFRLH
ncbi:MAG: lipopolysaccharide biosynthesis protein [bacterium]|nr:lipopolysaccharide biosynthesis protein [bacterium]MDD5756677.1 lipopolysaccharide biosynthesis protein [bacterium]